MNSFEDVYQYTKYLNILFVEDDEALRSVAGQLLEDLFATVSYSADGQDALENYNQYLVDMKKPYDLVITDIEMPNKNGIELIKNIQENSPEQPFVVVSGYRDSHYLLECINLGVSQYILKPIEFDNFFEVMGKVAQKILSKDDFKESNPDQITLCENLVWNKKESRLSYNNKMITLTKNEQLSIEFLIQNLDYICSIDAIIEILGNQNTKTNNESVRNMMSRLRKKLPCDLIKSIYGKGYKLAKV